MKKVLDGMPWNFDDVLILLKTIDGNEKPSEIAFNSTPIWVKLYDVPFNRRNQKSAITIGNHIGKFLEYDDSDMFGLEKTMKIKVQIDIAKPLMRGITMEVGGITKWIDLKYVRLPLFCYHCGVLGHVERDCLELEEGDGTPALNQFGPWLRASPSKPGLKKSSKENEKERVWVKRLEEKCKLREDKITGKSDGSSRKLSFCEEKDSGSYENVTGGYGVSVGSETTIALSVSNLNAPEAAHDAVGPLTGVTSTVAGPTDVSPQFSPTDAPVNHIAHSANIPTPPTVSSNSSHFPPITSTTTISLEGLPASKAQFLSPNTPTHQLTQIAGPQSQNILPTHVSACLSHHPKSQYTYPIHSLTKKYPFFTHELFHVT